MSFFLSYGEEQLEEIQQGIHTKKSELSQSTAGNLPLQPLDPTCVSKRGLEEKLFSKRWNCLHKNRRILHLWYKWCLDGLFFHSWIMDKSTDLSVNVWVMQAAYSTSACCIHAYINREYLQHQINFKIFYIRTFHKVIKINKFWPFSHDRTPNFPSFCEMP